MTGTWAAWSGVEGDEASRSQERLLEFEVEANGFDLPRLAREGRFQIRGRLRADGLTEGSDLWGVLEVHLVSKREILYAFYFQDDGGRQWFFRGRKILSFWTPRSSMTCLHATLYCQGQPRGRALVKFPWSSLPQFIASFEIVDDLGSPSSDEELDHMMEQTPDLSACSEEGAPDDRFTIE
jgi:hypothetical protein